MSATQQEIDRLIEQFDPESTFRRLAGMAALFVTVLTVGLSAWHYYTAGFGLQNEIAHRAIHLSVVLGLCFLVFPRQKRLGGHWEWTVSLFLVAFYLLMGLGLLDSLSDPVPTGAKLVFIAVLLCIAGLSLPFKAYDGSHTHIPLRDWIFAALHRAGLASQAESVDAADGLGLVGVRIVAAVRCAPPDNAPTPGERDTCAAWLRREVELTPTVRAVLVLGAFGWSAFLGTARALGWQVPRPGPRFGHRASVALTRPDDVVVRLVGSYHVSQQNTQTGRLTERMLDAAIAEALAAAG